MENGSEIRWTDRTLSDGLIVIGGVRDNDFFSIRKAHNDDAWRVRIFPFHGEAIYDECASLEEAKALCESAR